MGSDDVRAHAVRCRRLLNRISMFFSQFVPTSSRRQPTRHPAKVSRSAPADPDVLAGTTSLPLPCPSGSPRSAFAKRDTGSRHDSEAKFRCELGAELYPRNSGTSWQPPRVCEVGTYPWGKPNRIQIPRVDGRSHPLHLYLWCASEVPGQREVCFESFPVCLQLLSRSRVHDVPDGVYLFLSEEYVSAFAQCRPFAAANPVPNCLL